MLPPGWWKTRAETQSKMVLIIPEPTTGRRRKGQRESGCAVILGHPSSSHERSAPAPSQRDSPARWGIVCSAEI